MDDKLQNPENANRIFEIKGCVTRLPRTDETSELANVRRADECVARVARPNGNMGAAVSGAYAVPWSGAVISCEWLGGPLHTM